MYLVILHVAYTARPRLFFPRRKEAVLQVMLDVKPKRKPCDMVSRGR